MRINFYKFPLAFHPFLRFSFVSVKSLRRLSNEEKEKKMRHVSTREQGRTHAPGVVSLVCTF